MISIITKHYQGDKGTLEEWEAFRQRGIKAQKRVKAGLTARDTCSGEISSRFKTLTDITSWWPANLYVENFYD